MYEDEVQGSVRGLREFTVSQPRDGVGKGDGARSGAKRTWEDAMARATEADLANCRPYSIRDAYEEGDVVHHPVFDIGFVIELLPDNKVEVIFRDGGSRILVHNRGDLASRMPDISEIPVPREAKKKKRAKKAESPATPLAVRSKAEVEAAVLRARSAAQMRMDEAQKTQDERNKKLKAEAKATKGGPKGAKTAAVAAKPAAKAAKVAKAPPPAKKPVKAAKPAPAKKPAKAAKPAKKAAKPAKPAKKKKK
jgi:hypothetical protein